MQQQYVIIVAGGSGTRLQTSIPKQFVKLGDKEIIILAIEKFLNYNKNINIIISVHEDYLEVVKAMTKKHGINAQLVKGGATRYDSVKNALEMINDDLAIVGIHDAARPFVSVETIDTCYSLAIQKGNAVPSIGVHESLREINERGNKAVDRNKFKIIQTPQCFLVCDIQKAFKLPYRETFTDDASVLEADGHNINLVEGNQENIKITLPKDLLIAKTFLENE
ncbi:MAG: 2-C-methyl-D-erythritol 4-phosphate cytidylyltransferase [Bacteroidia bacterium]